MEYAYLKEVKTWEEAMDILKEEIEAKRPLFALAHVSLNEFLSRRYVCIPLAAFSIDALVEVALLHGLISFPLMNRIHIFIHTFLVEEIDQEAGVFVCLPCSPDEEFDPIQFMSLRSKESTYH